MKRFLQATLAVLFVLSAQYVAAQKPEDAIKFRRGVMAVIGWNFGSMAAMAQNKKPYDAATFARNAEVVAFMSKLPHEGFTPGSDTGDTKAKPEIWLDMDDFKAKLEDHGFSISALSWESPKPCHQAFGRRRTGPRADCSTAVIQKS